MYFQIFLICIILLYICPNYSLNIASRSRSISSQSRKLYRSFSKLYSKIDKFDDLTMNSIAKIIAEHPTVLFMKGTKERPMCGFSNNACRILDSLGIDYFYVDVLESNLLREGIKKYSNWPTIPQLYVKGEFIGGSDIMQSLFQSGELKSILEN